MEGWVFLLKFLLCTDLSLKDKIGILNRKGKKYISWGGCRVFIVFYFLRLFFKIFLFNRIFLKV